MYNNSIEKETFKSSLDTLDKGWRIPNREEWLELNKQYANCTWDKASTTGNYRDSFPLYNPIAGSHSRHRSGELYFYPGMKTAYYWVIDPKGLHALIYKIDVEKCFATLAQVGSTIQLLAQKEFYSCRCVKEAK